MKVYDYCLKNGISRTKEFEKKLLAELSVNTGLKCGHSYADCSTGAILRTHKAFRSLGLSSCLLWKIRSSPVVNIPCCNVFALLESAL